MTLNYSDQRYYASAYGRFNTADPYQALANGANNPSTPLSWNKYSYVLGDPVNWYDLHGMDEDDPDQPPPDGGGQSPCVLSPQTCNWSGPTLNSGPGPPPCNSSKNPTVQNKLAFVQANYAAALSEAKTVMANATDPNMTASGLATMFLQWSYGEGGYIGQWASVTASNNWFGAAAAGAGAWSGAEISCPLSSNGSPVTANACFSTSLSWGAELGDVLGTASGKTGVTYLQSLTGALNGGANAAQALQAIATNGWNPSPTYGYDKTTNPATAPNFGAQINCLESLGAIP